MTKSLYCIRCGKVAMPNKPGDETALCPDCYRNIPRPPDGTPLLTDLSEEEQKAYVDKVLNTPPSKQSEEKCECGHPHYFHTSPAIYPDLKSHDWPAECVGLRGEGCPCKLFVSSTPPKAEGVGEWEGLEDILEIFRNSSMGMPYAESWLLPAIRVALTSATRAAEEKSSEAYRERNMMVCALSKLFPAYLARHDESDTSWDRDWMWIVYIDLPTGQVSWHIHDSERDMFDHLEIRENAWDGHNTERKYQRLAALDAIPNGIVEASVKAAEERKDGEIKKKLPALYEMKGEIGQFIDHPYEMGIPRLQERMRAWLDTISTFLPPPTDKPTQP